VESFNTTITLIAFVTAASGQTEQVEIKDAKGTGSKE
jgi:hypothetical protein